MECKDVVKAYDCSSEKAYDCYSEKEKKIVIVLVNGFLLDKRSDKREKKIIGKCYHLWFLW